MFVDSNSKGLMSSESVVDADPTDVKLIAFYLPQFHPIPENDEWWGSGFTEWRNVAAARPYFPRHHQPKLPADLGFYDLRLPESRQAQADLARQYGVFGFCYYHFWFSGRRLLERPFNEVLLTGKPNFPFCLCWANENWTRVWDGSERSILMEQHYSRDDDLAHIQALAPALGDPRYIRVSGKPLLLIYRSSRLPEPARTLETWRNEARRLGVGELFLARVESNPTEHDDPRTYGFDAGVEFAPDWSVVQSRALSKLWNVIWKIGSSANLCQPRSARVIDYVELVNRMLAKPPVPYSRFRCVTPMWDNSARKRCNANIVAGSTPLLYENWLREVVRRSGSVEQIGKIVFINAWNEWAEGAYLEPDLRWGRAYLEATARVLSFDSRGRVQNAEILRPHPDMTMQL
jgi:lipopolysaccharide biosynthesis protein